MMAQQLEIKLLRHWLQLANGRMHFLEIQHYPELRQTIFHPIIVVDLMHFQQGIEILLHFLE